MALVLGLAALCGCGSSSPRASSTGGAEVASSPAIQAVITSTDLAPGRNRFTFGLLDRNHPINADRPSDHLGHPEVTFLSLNGNRGTVVSKARATFNHFARGLRDTDANSAAVEIGGVFVTYPTFTRAGNWGADIRFRYKGKPRDVAVQFIVQAHSSSPAIGSAAPRTHNPTTATVPAVKLDSGRPPDDMHKLSIAGALSQHKPLIVLFATAGFCQSRMCGPQIQVVQNLENQYGRRVNFVHIEVYKNANPRYGYAPAFLQWHLQSEPWVFVINRHGIVTAKFEGPTPGAEITPAIDAALH